MCLLDRVLSGGKYWLIRALNHPKATRKGKYVFEHVLIAENALGHYLPDKAVVHHIDSDKLNNANNNLVICENQGYHMFLHARIEALKACGNVNWRRCMHCKVYDDPSNMTANKLETQFYHKSCHAAYRYQQRQAL